MASTCHELEVPYCWQRIILFVLSIMMTVTGASAEIHFIKQPQNITIFSNQSAFMPCAVEGTQFLPNWNIDDKSYTADGLPTGLIMNSTGLKIHILTYTMFQCYLNVKNTANPPPYYQSFLSSIGTLTVIDLLPTSNTVEDTPRVVQRMLPEYSTTTFSFVVISTVISVSLVTLLILIFIIIHLSQSMGIPKSKASYLSVPNNELDSSNLVYFLEAIRDINDWQSLGLYIGLKKQPTLDGIAQQHSGDIIKCKTEMLQAWFDWVDNVEKFGKPSWRRFVDAVRKVKKPVADNILKEAPWKN